MDYKKLFEVAGVDTTSGKANRLIEGTHISLEDYKKPTHAVHLSYEDLESLVNGDSTEVENVVEKILNRLAPAVKKLKELKVGD